MAAKNISRHKGRGGARKGAGRPKGDSRTFSFRCPGELAERMDALDNKTEFIRESLIRALDGEVKPGMVPVQSVRPLRLPFFETRVMAGFPVPLDNDERSQDIEILSLLCPHPESSYLVRVRGNSMIDADILDGDIVIVDKSNREPGPRDIAVCELNGEYTLKRFVRENSEGWLVPANPEYPRFRITEDDDFSIWGVVTYIIHKARD